MIGTPNDSAGNGAGAPVPFVAVRFQARPIQSQKRRTASRWELRQKIRDLVVVECRRRIDVTETADREGSADLHPEPREDWSRINRIPARSPVDELDDRLSDLYVSVHSSDQSRVPEIVPRSDSPYRRLSSDRGSRPVDDHCVRDRVEAGIVRESRVSIRVVPDSVYHLLLGLEEALPEMLHCLSADISRCSKPILIRDRLVDDERAVEELESHSHFGVGRLRVLSSVVHRPESDRRSSCLFQVFVSVSVRRLGRHCPKDRSFVEEIGNSIVCVVLVVHFRQIGQCQK